jgi:hypothetical protein
MISLTDFIEKIFREMKIICNRESGENPLKTIMEYVNLSQNDEQLSKMSSFWNPWF